MRTLALIAEDPRARDELSTYLAEAGFQVRIVDRLERRDRRLVWLADDPTHASAISGPLHAWIAASEVRRAVLVTRRPAAFQELVRASGGRLTVLAPPVFGWQVVDALGGQP